MATIERSSFSTPSRVAVVGVGNVGATFAYALLLSGLAAEIALIDVNRAKAEGEAMDLNHAVPFSHPTKIWAGDFPDCAQAAVVVMAAGANQKPGETRLDLIYKNATIWRQVIPEIVKHNRSTILLIATDRKSTRLNSSHVAISYAVLCLKKKTHYPSAARILIA